MDVEQTIREYLPQIVHLSLATVKGNAPWVCEVHFAYDDDLNLYFRSLRSRRHSQEIAANPKVAGNIIVPHGASGPVRGVYFEGTAKLLQPSDEQRQAFELLQVRLGLGEAAWEEAKRADGHQIYKITVARYYLFDSVTSTPSRKYELTWKK